jgi:beta-glucosidase
LGTGALKGVDQSIQTYAQYTETCLVFINAYGGEGTDRTGLRNPTQDQLVVSIANNCNNTVVAVNTVGPRILDTWIEHPNVTAVLYGAPLGQESGDTIVDILYGDVNPSAKLTYTIAKNEPDYNAMPYTSSALQCDFTESSYIDYKHFDKYDIDPRFEFGYRLSCTTFEYSELELSTQVTSGPATGTVSVGGREDLWDEVGAITVTVKNMGDIDGTEVVQLYLTFPYEADQPVRQLRGFERMELVTGESSTVTFTLRRRDLSY